MSWKNYAAQGKIEMAKNQIGEVSNQNVPLENNENIDLTQEVKEEPVQKAVVEIEYVEFPKFVSINGVPKNIDFNYSQVGKLIMNYENSTSVPNMNL